jgi:hypothetical protein
MLGKITFILLLVLSSCKSGLKQLEVNYEPLFHDGNSKVWMVNKILASGQNFAPSNNWEKDILIFYNNGRCCLQPLKSLGESPGKKGEYAISTEQRNLMVTFKAEKWDFQLTTISEDKIVMKPIKGSDLNYTLELIPLPEL